MLLHSHTVPLPYGIISPTRTAHAHGSRCTVPRQLSKGLSAQSRAPHDTRACVRRYRTPTPGTLCCHQTPPPAPKHVELQLPLSRACVSPADEAWSPWALLRQRLHTPSSPHRLADTATQLVAKVAAVALRYDCSLRSRCFSVRSDTSLLLAP